MLDRVLGSRHAVTFACVASLLLGLFFVFVWSPLPWGWAGIDHYDERAARLAAGAPFDTTDVPWGYAYFVAAFYRLFGAAPLAPLLGQVALNTVAPLLTYLIARPLVPHAAARLAAALLGVFSFNTVYTSTLSADSVCTVIFLVLMLCYVRGRLSAHAPWLLAAGALGGLAAQFRPNLVLFPLVLAAVEFVVTTSWRRKLLHAAALVAGAGLVLSPWVVRNYRLTGEFLPTSTHGGVQLWYGTLQVGRYLESRADNPRSYFATAAFDYSSLEHRTIVVATREGCTEHEEAMALEYWTDRDPTRRTLPARGDEEHRAWFEIPGQPAPTAVYYRLISTSPTAATRTGPVNVVFVAREHLEDLDRHDDLLDIFDLIRLLRWLAWNERAGDASTLDLDGNGGIDRADLARAIAALLPNDTRSKETRAELRTTDAELRLTLADGSTLIVPRRFSGRITDVAVNGGAAAELLYARRTFASIAPDASIETPCGYPDALVVNEVFYRKEPHLMRRYFALAFDNIGRDPAAFALAAAYRTLRMFVILGSENRATAQQFASGRIVYPVGTVVSLVYLVLLVAGVWVTVRHYRAAWLLLIPVLYVPITLAPVLTNMRYTITVQPFAFILIAAGLVSMARWWRGRPGTHPAEPSGTTRE